ncbi:hypothetical protein OC861_005277 [Tilletia horrida]|nr:hypothetical protein OC861_005277 [Tilletia horrida]
MFKDEAGHIRYKVVDAAAFKDVALSVRSRDTERRSVPIRGEKAHDFLAEDDSIGQWYYDQKGISPSTSTDSLRVKQWNLDFYLKKAPGTGVQYEVNLRWHQLESLGINPKESMTKDNAGHIDYKVADADDFDDIAVLDRTRKSCASWIPIQERGTTVPLKKDGVFWTWYCAQKGIDHPSTATAKALGKRKAQNEDVSQKHGRK